VRLSAPADSPGPPKDPEEWLTTDATSAAGTQALRSSLSTNSRSGPQVSAQVLQTGVVQQRHHRLPLMRPGEQLKGGPDVGSG